MTNTSPICPRCPHPLAHDTIAETPTSFEVQRCTECRGLWVDAQTLTALEATVEPRLVEIRRIPKAAEQQALLRCPMCDDQVLEKLEHARDRKVIVDRCRVCQGWWLDGGELDAIRQESLPVFVLGMARYIGSLLREED